MPLPSSGDGRFLSKYKTGSSSARNSNTDLKVAKYKQKKCQVVKTKGNKHTSKFSNFAEFSTHTW